jgi:hypothetical protein
MSTTVMTAPIADETPRFRSAGFFWLLTFLTGSFALFAAGKLIVFGDAAATAANLLAHEEMFRLGSTANLLATVCYVAAILLVYEMLQPVSRSVSLLAAFFGLVGCATGAFSFLFDLAPLVILKSAPALSVFTTEELQALAFMFLRLGGQVSNIGLVFFGLHCLLVGALILRSTFLPKFVGALMVFAGLGWLANSFTAFLLPSLARAMSPYLFLPGMLGEATLTLWLLIVGVHVGRWKEQAGIAEKWRT